MRVSIASAAFMAATALSASPTLAGYGDFVGVRPLGTGGAMRAAATGDAGPVLNPSGMSLVRTYVVEGAYQNLQPDSGHALHASIVDSTSALNMGGGLYYTFTTASPGALTAKAHEGGFSLSLPFGERLFLGGTIKYIWDQTSGSPAGTDTKKGFTFDAGLTLRPIQTLAVAIVGYNLRDVGTSRTPRSVGGGVTFAPVTNLLLAFDSVLDFTDHDPSRGNVLSLMGGGEYVFGQSVAVRGGGGNDGLRKGGYFTVGLSLLSDVGAADLGFRQDVSGARKATFIGVSARLFVPAAAL